MLLYVGGLLIRDSRILLGKRSSTRRTFPGVWDVFGGHMKPHEPPTVALQRELEEELDIVHPELHFCEVIEDVLPMSRRKFRYWIYLVRKWTGEPKNRSCEHSVIGWFTLPEAKGLPLAHSQYVRLFEHYLHRDTPT